MITAGEAVQVQALTGFSLQPPSTAAHTLQPDAAIPKNAHKMAAKSCKIILRRAQRTIRYAKEHSASGAMMDHTATC
jgi:hypothetical protein